jgi:hypothetical protein
MNNVALGAAFLLEIVAFISFASVGFLFSVTHFVQLVIAFVLFVTLITFWSLYMAPKAPKKFKVVPYYVSKAVIYSLAALSIFKSHGVTLGILFVVFVILDEALLFKHNLS